MHAAHARAAGDRSRLTSTSRLRLRSARSRSQALGKARRGGGTDARAAPGRGRRARRLSRELRSRVGGRTDRGLLPVPWLEDAYAGRQRTDELRAEAAKVRRALRLGGNPRANAAAPSVDLDALLAALTPEQQAMLAAKTNIATGPGTGPKKNRRNPFGSRRLEAVTTSEHPKSGRRDSNP